MFCVIVGCNNKLTPYQMEEINRDRRTKHRFCRSCLVREQPYRLNCSHCDKVFTITTNHGRHKLFCSDPCRIQDKIIREKNRRISKKKIKLGVGSMNILKTANNIY